jgi:hypothetical protein
MIYLIGGQCRTVSADPSGPVSRHVAVPAEERALHSYSYCIFASFLAFLREWRGTAVVVQTRKHRGILLLLPEFLLSEANAIFLNTTNSLSKHNLSFPYTASLIRVFL